MKRILWALLLFGIGVPSLVVFAYSHGVKAWVFAPVAVVCLAVGGELVVSYFQND